MFTFLRSQTQNKKVGNSCSSNPRALGKRFSNPGTKYDGFVTSFRNICRDTFPSQHRYHNEKLLHLKLGKHAPSFKNIPVAIKNTPVVKKELCLTNREFFVSKRNLSGFTKGSVPVSKKDLCVSNRDIYVTRGSDPVLKRDFLFTNRDFFVTKTDFRVKKRALPVVFNRDLPVSKKLKLSIVTKKTSKKKQPAFPDECLLPKMPSPHAIFNINHNDVKVSSRAIVVGRTPRREGSDRYVLLPSFSTEEKESKQNTEFHLHPNHPFSFIAKVPLNLLPFRDPRPRKIMVKGKKPFNEESENIQNKLFANVFIRQNTIHILRLRRQKGLKPGKVLLLDDESWRSSNFVSHGGWPSEKIEAVQIHEETFDAMLEYKEKHELVKDSKVYFTSMFQHLSDKRQKKHSYSIVLLDYCGNFFGDKSEEYREPMEDIRVLLERQLFEKEECFLQTTFCSRPTACMDEAKDYIKKMAEDNGRTVSLLCQTYSYKPSMFVLFFRVHALL